MDSIMFAQYRLEKDGPLLPGILINSHDVCILDAQGDIVPKVWDYIPRADVLTINVTHLFKNQEV